MIQLNSTTNFKIRMKEGSTTLEKKEMLENTIRGLRMVETQTTRPIASDFRGARLQMDGTFAGMKFTKEGFRAVSNHISPHLYGLLNALDKNPESATETQVKIFNEALALKESNLENQRLVIRNKDGVEPQIEAMHSKTYGYISNMDALDILLRNSNGANMETVRIHGRKFDLMMSNPDLTVTIPTARAPEGEDIVQTHYINNSEDGSSRLMAGVGLYTFFCTNGMRIGQEFEMVNAVHRGNMQLKVQQQMSKLNHVDIQGVFEKIKESSTISLNELDLQNADKFLSTRVGKKLATHFTSLKRKFINDDRAITGYELFSGITEYAHRQDSLDEQLKLETVGYNYLDKLVAV